VVSVRVLPLCCGSTALRGNGGLGKGLSFVLSGAALREGRSLTRGLRGVDRVSDSGVV